MSRNQRFDVRFAGRMMLLSLLLGGVLTGVHRMHRHLYVNQLVAQLFQIMRSQPEDEVLRVLSELPADRYVHLREQPSGRTPLHTAASRGMSRVVQALLRQGAAGDALAGGITPLYAAAANRHPDCVRLLLEHGVAVDGSPGYGATPLIWSSMVNGDEEVIRLLLAWGADAAATDRYGWTALDHAVSSDQPAIAMLLREAQAERERAQR